MNYAKISELLDAELRNNLIGNNIYEENEKVKAKAADTWLRTTLLPAEAEVSTLGPTGVNRHHGLFQIDVWKPSDLGKDFEVADNVLAIFSRGKMLIDGAIRVLITASWLERSIKENTNYNTPVLVRWECFF